MNCAYPSYEFDMGSYKLCGLLLFISHNLFPLFLVCDICAFVCVCVCSVFVQVHRCVEDRDQNWVSFTVSFHLIFFENLELINFTQLVGQ